MKIKFICPECHEPAEIEELIDNICEFTKILEVSDGDISYGEIIQDGGEFIAYQCVECGWRIPTKNLFEWLKENNMLEEQSREEIITD